MRLVRKGSRKPKKTVKKRKGIRFRMKAIPSIKTSEMDWESMSMEWFLNMKVPYLAVNPINYTLLMEDYPIIEGTGEVYRLNRDFSFTPIKIYHPKNIIPPLQYLNRRLRIKDKGYEFTPADLFIHKFADIFNPQKWIQLGVKDTKFFRDLFSDVPDDRISTKPNIIHLFIFLNAMPALIDFMHVPDSNLRTSVERFFNQSEWELINFMDVKRITGKINRENLIPTLEDKETKKRFSSILCSHDPVLGKDCPTPIKDPKAVKKLWQGELTALLQSIKNLRTIFQSMQTISNTENLGYIFLLNYWIFRVMNLSIIQNKLPINASQQMETLMTAYAIEGTTFDYDILQLDVSNFVPQDSVGIFKGISYPNCVENTVFKLFQVLIWDFDRQRYKPVLLENNNPVLRAFLEGLNESKDKTHLEWNNLVSGLPNVQYNASKDGKGYNIRSNRLNVLALLNTLTATSYHTIKEWTLKVTERNNFLNHGKIKVAMEEINENDEEYEDNINEDMDDENFGEEIFININSLYNIEVRLGHSSFMVSMDEMNIDQFIHQLSISSLYAINEFGFSNTANSIIIDSIYKRSDFRIRYITNLVNMTTDDNIIPNIKHPDDLFEMRKYRNISSILDYIRIPIPVGFIPNDTIDLIIPDFFNQTIGQNVLPSGLQTLTFGWVFNKFIDYGVLPAGLQTLNFGQKFNQPIERDVLPIELKNLTFGNEFNHSIQQVRLLNSLQTLKLGFSFNQPIEAGVLPSSLQSLTFGSEFNQPIGQDVLPAGLQSLTFGYSFDQFIDYGVLPTGLQTLIFGKKFNQPIDKGVLPTSLQTLSFGSSFNRPIILPEGLKSLIFGYFFNQPFQQGRLPKDLQTLVFGFDFKQEVIFPSGLKDLTLGGYFNQPIEPGTLPPNLQTLTFGSYFNYPIEEGELPSNLKSLTFGEYFNQPIEKGDLPSGLLSLTFGDKFNRSIKKGSLPNSLQSLTFGNDFNKPIKRNVLPSGLQKLIFGNEFDQPIEIGVLPNSLQVLTFGEKFIQPIEPGSLPPNLQSLTFGIDFYLPIRRGILPEGLKHLTFGENYDEPFDDGVLPSSLQRLQIGINDL
jgi:hypothetical protein